MARTRKVKLPTAHELRCRFNSGFHDAVLAVKQGWATPERNMGFASGAGPFATPEDVRTKHFDRHYGEGWAKGHKWATAGLPTDSSEPAWVEWVRDTARAGWSAEKRDAADAFEREASNPDRTRPEFWAAKARWDAAK